MPSNGHHTSYGRAKRYTTDYPTLAQERGDLAIACWRKQGDRTRSRFMKAYELQNSFGIYSLTLTERPEPKPCAGQVLLKIRAWSLNYRDLMVVKGTYHPKLRLPFTPLSDGVGEVGAVGEGVSRVRQGDRVSGVRRNNPDQLQQKVTKARLFKD